MITPFLATLEHSDFARALRETMLFYPIINTLHIFGIALLFGAIASFDIAVIARRPADRLAHLKAQCIPLAGVGLVLAIVTGVTLFIARAQHYAAHPVMLAKFALLAIGLINIALLHGSRNYRALDTSLDAEGSPRLRAAAWISLLCWIGVIIAGRFVAYF
ncbi:MAG: hypothetical protein C0606_11395 [Hyphomicrobiales bacterium]|nr:MAG: hypothetical protein C0606_11395 [Hyphomicrobiales bacterium]